MQATPTPWRTAHVTAEELHSALRDIGITETVLGTVRVRRDAAGGLRVAVPPLPVADVERLLTALGGRPRHTELQS
jgi:hypothetical protein